METVIEVFGICKGYPLFNKKSDKIKEAFSLRRRKYHRDFMALDDISFSVSRGECVGIVGVNGSGKSTLLKIISGIIQPSSGHIIVDGRISALIELGAGFNPELTGRENIYLNSLIQGLERDYTDGKLKEILGFADIGEFIDQPVKSYSSGMFVRLAFAVAVAAEPDILIVDEALSVGDVFFQQKSYQKIRELTKKSTVLIVSHDLNSITRLCDRVLVMHRGHIIYNGKTRDGVTEFLKIKQGRHEGSKGLSGSDECRQDVDIQDYRTADPSSYSGKMDITISRYYYQVNRSAFEEYVRAGDRIFVKMLIKSEVVVSSAIFGYQVRDVYGNEVFGETSMTSGYSGISISPGDMVVDFCFEWPEIREGDYFITLGVGEGTEVLNQVEQCWINQAIHFYNVTDKKLIYGLFNNEMSGFSLNRVG